MQKTTPICGMLCVVLLSVAGCLSQRGGSAVSPGVAQGNAVQLVWRNVDGDAVSDLTGSERYSKPPDQARLLPDLQFGAQGNHYGSATVALLCPPETGAYTFWLATDDGGELLLSTDETAANCRSIATVSGYTGECEWDRQPTQKSDIIWLEKDRRYFIKALQKQGGGGNHMAVGWSGPTIPNRELIRGAHLARADMGTAISDVLARTRKEDAERARLKVEVTAMVERGDTLPVELVKRLPYSPRLPANDTGINVLLDQAHQTTFAHLWGLKGHLGGLGFRVCSSIATLNTVLAPGKPSRIRFAFDDLQPYAWWPNPEFNVVITRQTDLNAQPYTQQERAALKAFVEGGGGLLVLARTLPDADAANTWSLAQLVTDYGAHFVPETGRIDGAETPVLALEGGWEVLAKDDRGRPLRARRVFGAGRVLVWGADADFVVPRKADKETAEARKNQMKDVVTWLAAGRQAVGGDPGMPGGGGVNIFPENVIKLEGINIYYASNQGETVLDCLQNQVPAAYQQVRRWLPSRVFAEPYGMVICAGGGGGWAIGGRPKSSALITYSADGILSIMAHEVAHTLGGPRNAEGELAGRSPHHNQGEAHAGWFQGKVNAKYTSNREELLKESNRKCNGILDVEKRAGEKIDLANYDREKWGKGRDWTKYWWVWQKLDDRYGPTWYTRWYWVRTTRWQDDPGHSLTFDEMVEDMSIAVGEDLFPFFRAVGTTLGRERLESIEFGGKTLVLPVAPIDTGPAGPVRIEEIGDYTKPLAYK